MDMQNNGPPGPDFSMILASTVHDMKNSLGLLLNTLDEAISTCQPASCPSYGSFSKLQYEAKRVNNDLIQLLTLYKIGNNQFSAHIADHSLADFIEECVLQNKPLLEFKNIEIEVECPDELYWFFDRDLMSGIVNNVINNAMRYTRDRLRLSAGEQDGYAVINIEDNGAGYPQTMLQDYDGPRREVSFRSGSTGLGLYFAATVARLHRNQDRTGYITLANGGALGGGRFSVHLP